MPAISGVSSLTRSAQRSAEAEASSCIPRSRLSAFRNSGSWLPEFADRINGIQHRLFDLLPIVREHVYHPAFGGSYSLKSTLPALVPEMTYGGMEVADGQAAGLAWDRLIRDNCGEAERERTRRALLEYCAQDTLGMMRLMEILQRAKERP